MKKFNLNSARLESDAAERNQWRQAVREGASNFVNERSLTRSRDAEGVMWDPHLYQTIHTPLWCARNADKCADRWWYFAVIDTRTRDWLPGNIASSSATTENLKQ